jgi:uncharacterized membrane protein
MSSIANLVIALVALLHFYFLIFDLKLFFLGCVLIAGLYGAATANRKILFVQAFPAALGLVLLLLS